MPMCTPWTKAHHLINSISCSHYNDCRYIWIDVRYTHSIHTYAYLFGLRVVSALVHVLLKRRLVWFLEDLWSTASNNPWSDIWRWENSVIVMCNMYACHTPFYICMHMCMYVRACSNVCMYVWCKSTCMLDFNNHHRCNMIFCSSVEQQRNQHKSILESVDWPWWRWSYARVAYHGTHRGSPVREAAKENTIQ